MEKLISELKDESLAANLESSDEDSFVESNGSVDESTDDELDPEQVEELLSDVAEWIASESQDDETDAHE